MANERLYSAMAAANVDAEAIRKATGVDPKTVHRWLNGRVPHPGFRRTIAAMLKEREDFLWPRDERRPVAASEQTAEIVAAYAHRADVPAHIWRQFFLQAQKQIDLLGYAMLFLPEQHSNLEGLLKEKAAHGCKIRIALADPTSVHVRLRDEEERLGGTLPGLIRTTVYHFSGLRNHSGIEMGYHATALYNSIFRFDDDMFVTPHLYGVRGAQAPLMHLCSLGEHGIFANFVAHFESVWATTTPVP